MLGNDRQSAEGDGTPAAAPTLRVHEGIDLRRRARRSRSCRHAISKWMRDGPSGVIGPSASGKSSLARLLTGVWAPDRGTIRLDGATLDQWNSDSARTAHRIPAPGRRAVRRQRCKDNISRFSPQPKPEAVIAAANAAGVHDLILRAAERL